MSELLRQVRQQVDALAHDDELRTAEIVFAKCRHLKPALELLAPAGLNAVCFRFRGADDDRNQTILANLINGGTALLGPVRSNNRRGVRVCITNYRTRKSDIDVVLDRFVRLGESQRSV